MQLLKNKKLLIFIGFVLVVVIGFIIYLFTRKNVENMTNTLDSSQANLNLIDGIVRKIYAEDMTRLRNLDATINDLQTQIRNGRVSIPAGIQSNDLIMKGPIFLDYNSSTHPANPGSRYDGAIYRQDRQMYIASDDLIRFRRLLDGNSDPHRIQFDVRSGDANFDGKLHVGGKIFSKQDLSIYNQNKLAKDNNSYEWKFVNYPGEGTGRGNLTLGEVNKNNEWRNRIRFNDNGGETNLWSDLNISGNLRIENNGKLIMDNNTEIDKDKLHDLMNTQIGFVRHVNLRGNATTQQEFTITFRSRFRSIPVIQTSYNRYHEHWDRSSRYEITVSNITNAGFKLKIRLPSTASSGNDEAILNSGIISWIAISSCCPPQYINGTNNNSISDNYPTEY
jgi:hypothetical protein